MVADSAAVSILLNFLRKIVLQRHLIWNFVRRDLKVRFVGSFMGLFWAVIHPLVLLLCYTFVFTVIIDYRPLTPGNEPFAIFLFCGILPWLYFQDSLQRACQSIVGNQNLIRKTLFPAEILPVTIILANLVTHLIGFLILLSMLAYLGTLGSALVALPLYLLALVLLTLGLAWALAALQVFLRDTAQVLAVTLVFWFWFTPIFYRLEQVPEAYRIWFHLNPLVLVVEGYRLILLENQFPSFESVATLFLAGGLCFVAGGWIFRVTKREFVDVL